MLSMVWTRANLGRTSSPNLLVFTSVDFLWNEGFLSIGFFFSYYFLSACDIFSYLWILIINPKLIFVYLNILNKILGVYSSNCDNL